MLLFKLKALTLCVVILWYFSFAQFINLIRVVCSEELESEFKQLAKGSGVCLIFCSLNVKESWVKSAEMHGRPSSTLPQLSGSCSVWDPSCYPGIVSNKPHREWDWWAWCWLNVVGWLLELVSIAHEGACCLFFSGVGRCCLGKPLLPVSICSPFAKLHYCNDAICFEVLHNLPHCRSQGVWLKLVESSLGFYWLWYLVCAP